MKKRVLVLDDEDVICEVVEEELIKEGFLVKVAYTGQEALDLINDNVFDLILVDLKLSTPISGIEVVRTFKSLQPQGKVAVITGYPDPALVEEAMAVGADAYLSKPGDINPGVIGGRVKKILGQ